MELARRLGVGEATAWFMVQRIASVADLALPVRVDGVVERAVGAIRNPREKRRYDGAAPQELVVALLRVDVAALAPLRLVRAPSDDVEDVTVVTAEHVTGGRVLSARASSATRVPPSRLALVNLAHVVGGVHTRFAPHRLQSYLDVFSFRFTWRHDLGAGFLDAVGMLPRVSRRTRGDIARPSPA